MLVGTSAHLDIGLDGHMHLSAVGLVGTLLDLLQFLLLSLLVRRSGILVCLGVRCGHSRL